MHLPFQDMRQFKGIIEESMRKEVFIFITSRKCPVSSAAQTHIDAFNEERDADVYTITVETESAVAYHVETYFRIPHECPQLVCVSRGKPLFVLAKEEIDIRKIKAFLG